MPEKRKFRGPQARGDFFGVSNLPLRDLLFHGQETQVDLAEIKRVS